MILHDHRWLPVWFYMITGGFRYAFTGTKTASLGSLKTVAESIFKFSKSFSKEQAKTDFFINKATKKQKTTSSCPEHTYKYSFRDPIPLMSWGGGGYCGF